jgi:hypothetical protein
MMALLQNSFILCTGGPIAAVLRCMTLSRERTVSSTCILRKLFYRRLYCIVWANGFTPFDLEGILPAIMDDFGEFNHFNGISPSNSEQQAENVWTRLD